MVNISIVAANMETTGRRLMRIETVPGVLPAQGVITENLLGLELRLENGLFLGWRAVTTAHMRLVYVLFACADKKEFEGSRPY